MKKLISTELTVANIAKVTALLANAPEKLEQLSKLFSETQLNQPFAPGERSFTEILAHLLHCEARSAEAIYLALLADEPLFTNVHPEREFGKLLRYDFWPFAELLAYFKFRRAVLLRVLAELTPEKWARCIQESGKKRKESVYWLARSLALHELEHVNQVEKWQGTSFQENK